MGGTENSIWDRGCGRPLRRLPQGEQGLPGESAGL